MYSKYILPFCFLFIMGCGGSFLKVTNLDTKTGRFPTESSATLVTNKVIDLDGRKELLFSQGDFTRDMAAKIKYFDEVINQEDLEKIIITNNLTDAVPSLQEKIGLNKAAKAYKPFLWLRWDVRSDTDSNKRYTQLILTDPLTLEDYFVAETYRDVVWAGVNDKNNFYPLMNAFIDYINEHSKSRKK